MGKIKLKSNYKNHQRTNNNSDDDDDNEKNVEKPKMVVIKENEEEKENKKKKSGSELVKKVRFKATAKKLKVLAKNSSSNTERKVNDKKSSEKAKLEEIKKQIVLSSSSEKKLVDNDEAAKSENKLFKIVTKPPRLTNTLIKNIIMQNPAANKNGAAAGATGKLLNLNTSGKGAGVISKLDKKSKSKLKKHFWNEKIDLIKSQLKENADKVKREKTVIVGDMKPIIDSLDFQPTETKTKPTNLFQAATTANNNNNNNKHTRAAKKEISQKNAERERAKSIPKQSIRNKLAQDDLSLFNQLKEYNQFTSNPLEMLKKHFGSS